MLLGPFGMVPNASGTIWYWYQCYSAAPERIGIGTNGIAAKIEHLVFGTIPNPFGITFGIFGIGTTQPW